MGRFSRIILIAGLSSLMAACQPSAPDDPSPTAEPPPCRDDPECEPVGAYTSDDPDGFAVYLSAERNAAIVEWAQCLDDARACFEQGGDIPACMESSRCEARCLEDFRQRVDGSVSLTGQLDAFESVFVNDDAMCRPSLAGEQP
jgi:hypothetical protein